MIKTFQYTYNLLHDCKQLAYCAAMSNEGQDRLVCELFKYYITHDQYVEENGYIKVEK